MKPDKDSHARCSSSSSSSSFLCDEEGVMPRAVLAGSVARWHSRLYYNLHNAEEKQNSFPKCFANVL